MSPVIPSNIVTFLVQAHVGFGARTMSTSSNTVFLCLAFAAFGLGVPASSAARDLNGFSIVGASVPPEEIRPGGPPRDGIPALDEPRFIVGQSGVDHYPPGTRALVVREGSEVKAYALPVLNWHEAVNDTVRNKAGERPILVTYCPLCGTGIVFESKAGKSRLTFGVSGLVYQSDMLLYDRQTESLWSQLRREAIVGKQKGRRLSVIPSTLELLGDVVRKHPQAKVLSTDTGHRREYSRNPYAGYEQSEALTFPVNHEDDKAPRKAWSLLLETRNGSLIVPVDFLEPPKGEVELTVAGRKVTVVYDRNTRQINCARPVEGVVCFPGYYFALRTFYPQAKVHDPRKKE